MDAQQQTQIEVSPQIAKAKRLAAFTGCIAALAVLSVVLFFGIKGGWEVSDWFDWQIFRENTISYKDSYTVKDKKAEKKQDVVIATLGDKQLTNGLLQIYYWNEVYTFYSNNYYSLSYLGLDISKPLDEQQYTADKTWQQYFMELALQSWQANQALALKAEEADFVMPEKERKELDNMRASLETKALEAGYADAEAMVKDNFGAGCTLQDYIDYMEVYYYGYLYFAELYDQIDPSMDEIEDYFVKNEAALKESGVTKDDGYTVDVRHILMLIDNFVQKDKESGTDAQADGETSEKEEESKYTDAEWEACKAAAQEILDLWLTNPTEDYFGELANKHSDDQDGKVTNGGLYSDVEKGKMVAEFEAWIFDESRQPGDTGLVKTKYGYHVMYFVGSEEIWITACRNAIISEAAQKIVNDACDAYNPEINYKKIVLANMNF